MSLSIEERVLNYYENTTENSKFVKDLAHSYVKVATERDELKKKLEEYEPTEEKVTKTVLETVDLKQLKEK